MLLCVLFYFMGLRRLHSFKLHKQVRDRKCETDITRLSMSTGPDIYHEHNKVNDLDLKLKF